MNDHQETRDPLWLSSFLFLLVIALGAACLTGGGWLIYSGGWQSILFGLSLILIFSVGFFFLAGRALAVGIRDRRWWR